MSANYSQAQTNHSGLSFSRVKGASMSKSQPLSGRTASRNSNSKSSHFLDKV